MATWWTDNQWHIVFPEPRQLARVVWFFIRSKVVQNSEHLFFSSIAETLSNSRCSRCFQQRDSICYGQCPQLTRFVHKRCQPLSVRRGSELGVRDSNITLRKDIPCALALNSCTAHIAGRLSPSIDLDETWLLQSLWSALSTCMMAFEHFTDNPTNYHEYTFDGSPQGFAQDGSLEFGKACEDVQWNHRTSTARRSETNVVAGNSAHGTKAPQRCSAVWIW